MNQITINKQDKSQKHKNDVFHSKRSWKGSNLRTWSGNIILVFILKFLSLVSCQTTVSNDNSTNALQITGRSSTTSTSLTSTAVTTASKFVTTSGTPSIRIFESTQMDNNWSRVWINFFHELFSFTHPINTNTEKQNTVNSK